MPRKMRMPTRANDHTQVRRAIVDGARPRSSRAIDVNVLVAASHVEIAALDANGNAVAIARVEHWNGEIVAHLWDADIVRVDGEPQTIHLIDAARVKTKGKRG